VHVRAGFGEPARYGCADAARGARDHRNATGEVEKSVD
jgi:hypothetical protein